MSENRAVFMFPHVPKCAGASVQAFLAHALPPESVSIIYSEPEREPWLMPVALVPQAKRDALQVLYGHRLPRSAIAGFTGRPIREIGLLRDPVSWFVSMYNFVQKAPDRHHVAGLSFAKWYGASKRNRISRFYLKQYFRLSSGRMRFLTERDRFELLSQHFKSFWFVGDYRNCDGIMAKIAEVIGVPFEKLPHTNAAARDGIRVQDLDESLRVRIREENRLDQALYEAWSKRLWDGQPDLSVGSSLSSRWTWSNIAS